MNQQEVMKRESFWSRYAQDFKERNDYVAGKDEIAVIKGRLSQLRDLGDCLELGCGDGVFSRTVGEMSKSLVATDWSGEMVEAARSRLKGASENIHVKRENCLDLSFDKDVFDTVVMANLLHVIPFPERALKECKRVLKPGGRIVILSFTMQGMGLFHGLGLLYRYLKTYGKPPAHSRALRTKDAVRMLEKEGFSILRQELIGNKMKSVFVTARTLESNGGAWEDSAQPLPAHG